MQEFNKTKEKIHNTKVVNEHQNVMKCTEVKKSKVGKYDLKYFINERS